jgi:hypothetical protein
MNKKLLITIGAILVIVGGFAFVTMRRASLEKQLGHKASFREFLGLGDKVPAKDGAASNGILSSLFNNPNASGSGPGGTIGGVFHPLVSLFTSAPSTVDDPSVLPGGESPVLNSPWFDTPNQQTGTNTPPPPCSDVDLNIPFTVDEQNKLNDLNNTFQSLYQKLYDDTNVSDEQSTYDAVNLELQKVKELRKYCEDWAPNLGGYYVRRVATPFWNGGVADSVGFLSTGLQTGIQTYNVQGVYADYNTVENNFKLNIW